MEHPVTPGVKKLGYVFATKKKDVFGSEISHVCLPPHQETSKFCSSYCDIPMWRDVGCHGPQQLTSLGHRFQLQQLMVLKQMCYHLFYDFCTKQKLALQQPELACSLFFLKAA